MSALKIFQATEKDAPIVLTFIRMLAEYEKLAHECVATLEGLRNTLFAVDSPARVFIAEWEGKPAGFALYFFNYSTFLAKPGIYLEDLFVDPSMRGRGIGKALLQRLAQEAVSRGCGRLEWSVLDWNQPAIVFYRACGARPMDEWTVYRMTGGALSDFASLKADATVS